MYIIILFQIIQIEKISIADKIMIQYRTYFEGFSHFFKYSFISNHIECFIIKNQRKISDRI